MVLWTYYIGTQFLFSPFFLYITKVQYQHFHSNINTIVQYSKYSTIYVNLSTCYDQQHFILDIYCLRKIENLLNVLFSNLIDIEGSLDDDLENQYLQIFNKKEDNVIYKDV